MKTALILTAGAFMAAGWAGSMAAAGDAGDDTILSSRATSDSALTADPDSPFWRSVQGVLANRDNLGNPVTGTVMTVRSRWTEQNLYVLFICPYHSLYLKPNPKTDEETNGLWDWDVAETFIGDDFENINLYKEFEVSPQGEWVDLDIDRNKLGGSPDAWRWNSGFKVKAGIDPAAKTWYGEMCIPFQSISKKKAASGLKLRINFFRIEGPEPHRLLLTWRPTHAPSFHVPAAFGTIQLSTSGN